ncbi:MAG TPA: hypothetical protein VMC09_01095, partial [Anaerolineales bacterium]|nr:hypothetical protein [Anaerolineales bacterium]
HTGIQGIRRIDNSEFLRFEAAVGQIADFTIHHALLEICEANFSELMLCYENAQERFRNTHQIDETINDEILNEINRLLINYLSSFRTMIDHYQTRCTRLDRGGSQYLGTFKVSTANIYDASFSYRFIYQLRNYVQHCGLPVGCVGAEVYKNEAGDTVAQLSVYFDRDSLLTRFNKWGKIKNELEAQPARIEISVHLVEFHQRVLELYRALVQMELDIVNGARLYLSGLVSEVHSQLPGARPLIVDFSQVSAAGGNLPARVIPIKELARIQEVEKTINSNHGE